MSMLLDPGSGPHSQYGPGSRTVNSMRIQLNITDQKRERVLYRYCRPESGQTWNIVWAGRIRIRNGAFRKQTQRAEYRSSINYIIFRIENATPRIQTFSFIILTQFYLKRALFLTSTCSWPTQGSTHSQSGPLNLGTGYQRVWEQQRLVSPSKDGSEGNQSDYLFWWNNKWYTWT